MCIRDSSTTISASSDRRRARAAALMPPATPPTTTIFMRFLTWGVPGSGAGSAVGTVGAAPGPVSELYPGGYLFQPGRRTGTTSAPVRAHPGEAGCAWPTPRSGEREEELLQLGPVDAGGFLALGEATLQAGGDDGEARAVEGLGGCGELGDHVGAVSAGLQHLDHTADLALGAAEAIDDRRHLLGVELHGAASFLPFLRRGHRVTVPPAAREATSPPDRLVARYPAARSRAAAPRERIPLAHITTMGVSSVSY